MKEVIRIIILILMLSVLTIQLLACNKDKAGEDKQLTENITQLTEAPIQEDKSTQALTEELTEKPTEKPTEGPTVRPAEKPIEGPTEGPTEKPTEKLTQIPTEAPVPLETVEAPMPADNWSEDMKEMKDISSIELVKEIKIGWNLGNTLDATGGSTNTSEISWGNPLTSKKLIDAIKEAGFNAIRIPITWQNHLSPAPEYTINKDWMKRIQEIVDYAMANDMYVIINAHHEDWYFPSFDNADVAKDEMAKLWIQIAEYFQNYDEHLIFEGMNEPRQKGTPYEWNGGNEEGWDIVNQLNQVFIDTVRNSGGNNSLRNLMITPYAATSNANAWAKFIVPKDDKIIVSIHAYTPYNFALNKTGTDSWNSSNASETGEIDDLINSIDNKFIGQGIPVILGEFGAMNKNENTKAREDWAEYYVSKAAEKGIPCFWWDNGAFNGSGENFGLIDRIAIAWKYPEIVDALMKGVQ